MTDTTWASLANYRFVLRSDATRRGFANLLWYAIANNLFQLAIALAIFRFSGTWGSFFWPLIVLRSTKMFTLPVALSSIFGAYESPYDLLLAGSLLSLIPPMALFFATQRFFLKSLIAGAFK